MYRELLLGSGNRAAKSFVLPGEQNEFSCPTTVDIDPNCAPDVQWDLNLFPWPFDDNSFDEIWAIEVLEHLGTQGDFKAFLKCFEEIWRILKPKGRLYASCPSWQSIWAWSDPGHTRIISQGSIVFLNQAEYERQIGHSPMSDYRWCYKGDLRPYQHNNVPVLSDDGDTFRFVLEAWK